MLTGERAVQRTRLPQAIMAKRFTETPMPSSRSVLAMRLPKQSSWPSRRRWRRSPTRTLHDHVEFAQALVVGSASSTPTDTCTIPQAASPAAKSVAVLPFTNMSADPENEYFTDGMAEEIINALSKIQRCGGVAHVVVRVQGKERRHRRDRTKAQGLDGSRGQRAQDGQQASHHCPARERRRRIPSLVGAVRPRDGGCVRDSGRHLAGDREGAAGDPDRRREEADRDRRATENVQAYDYYLRGRQFFHQLAGKSLEYARQMFNSAIEIDPEYARAYAGVADSCSLLYTYFDAREFNLRQADIASQKALELEPELAEAHVARGLAVSLSKRFDEAEQRVRDGDEARSEAVRGARTGTGARFSRAGSIRGSGRRCSSARRRCGPRIIRLPGFLAQAYESLGRSKTRRCAMSSRARARMEDSLELNPDDARAANLCGGLSYANLGESDKAVGLRGRSLAIDPEDPMLLYNVACTYVALGTAKTMRLTALEQGGRQWIRPLEWIDHDPDLDPLRDEPRFQLHCSDESRMARHNTIHRDA